MSKVPQSILGVGVIFLAAFALATPAMAASFSTATRLGKAHFPSCGTGFPDLEGKCWKCPAGYKHDNILLPPTHGRVCKMEGQTTYRQGTKYEKSTAGCPAGQWPSLHNGYCYSCPQGFSHDLLRNGDDGQVCFKQMPEQITYRQGTKYRPSTLTVCPRGQWVSLHNGYCYSCPQGFSHDLARSGDDGKVCFKKMTEPTAYRQGTKYGKFAVGCPAGQWVSLHNGYCYSCPQGFSHDLARSGDDGRVCFQKQQDSYAQATWTGGVLCDRGFFDPINGGSCWSCPANWYRTVAPVNGEKACTNQLGGIFAIDICTPVITAIREGNKGLMGIESILQKIVSPVLKPLSDVMQKLTPQIKTPAELDKLVDKLGESLRPYADVIDEVQRLREQVDKTGGRLQNLLLNPKVICGGNPAEIDRQLTALGLRPNLGIRKSGLMDNFLIGNAHAQTKGVYIAFNLALNLIPLKEPGLPKSPINSIVLTYVTNFAGKASVLVSLGHNFSSNPSAGYSVGVHVFPSADICGFDFIENLGTEVSFDKGLVRKLFGKAGYKASDKAGETTGEKASEKAGGTSRVIPDSFNVSFDPLFQSVPGFGFSKDIYTITEADKTRTRIRDFIEVSFDCSFPVAGERC